MDYDNSMEPFIHQTLPTPNSQAKSHKFLGLHTSDLQLGVLVGWELRRLKCWQLLVGGALPKHQTPSQDPSKARNR